MNIQLLDYSIDLLQAILWQYNDAANLQSILSQKQSWYEKNQTEFWQNWFNDVFNLDTANEFGLTVWSIILNLPLQIGLPPDPIDKPLFGFGSETMTPNTYVNFNNGNFATAGSSFQLTTEEKRLVLKLRYFQLISNSSIPQINQFLNTIFSAYPGQVYVIDGLKMFIRVVFTFDPGDRLIFILKKYDLIPRGAGVGIEYVVDVGSIFGFGSETATPNGYVNFNNGNFLGVS